MKFETGLCQGMHHEPKGAIFDLVLWPKSGSKRILSIKKISTNPIHPSQRLD